MSDVGVGVETRSRAPSRASRPAARRGWWLTAVAVWGFFLGNAAVIVWLWWHGGNVSGVHTEADALTSVARITGLLGAYLALVQVVLLSRIPWLERLAGFDRLTVWHRYNGWLCLDLVIAHVVFSVWGYARLDRYSLGKEISTLLGSGIYPGMITATVGTGLLIAVAASSAVIVKRRLRYEAWYAVHFTAYAAIALAWFHQIPTGNELVLDTAAADYWRGLYAAALAFLVVFRVAQPLVNALRYRLRVASVESEGAGVVSVRITGRGLDRLDARPGQFFLWRFLDRGRWWAAHPFSLSAAPDGRSLRITVKALGDFSGDLGTVAPGTRVVAEGPLGHFTEDARLRDGVVLIAGGIGITPVRALAERMDGDVVLLYRVLREEDVVFREELEALSQDRGIRLELVVGDHATPDGARLLSPDHLRELVPDLDDRDVYVCGPPAMTDALVKSVRRAGVSHHHIHAERFAL